MKRDGKTIATGGVVLTPDKTAERRVEFKLFLPAAASVEVKWYFLDSDRMALKDANGKPLSPLNFDIGVEPFESKPSCPEESRIIQGLGNQQVFVGRGQLVIPESLRELSRYCGIEFLPTFQSGVRSPNDRLYVERLKCDLAIGQNPEKTYAFLLTEKSFHERIECIDAIMKRTSSNTNYASDAMVSLTLNVLGGFDNELVAFYLE